MNTNLLNHEKNPLHLKHTKISKYPRRLIDEKKPIA